MSVGTNWSRAHAYRATTLHRPTSLNELRSIVEAAPKIRALGTRHSFNDLADSTELVTLAGMPADIQIDEVNRTVRVSGGVLYGVLGSALHSAGWALGNLASLPHISVAGAIATATHGSGDRNGTLASAVAAIDLVTATGELRHFPRGHAEFNGVVVSLGALGVVSHVTLDIEPTFDVRQDVYMGVTWPTLLERYDEITASAYSVSVFTNWASDDVGLVWLKSRMDAPSPPTELFGRAAERADVHPLAGMPATNTTQQGGMPGAWIDRLSHFRLEFTPSSGDELQSEYIVPRQHAVSALRAIRELHPLITPHLQVTELRTMAAEDLWLSGSYGTAAVGIHFTWRFEPAAVLALLPTIEGALAPFDARPHWGKLFASVGDVYPRLGDFRQLVAELDPTDKFRNEFLDRNVF